MILRVVFFLFITNYCFCQNEIDDVIGEKELAGVEIYDLHYAKNEKLYIASNQGLFVYSGGVFTKVKNADNQKGNSIFQLLETAKGSIIFNNLSGQWFIFNDDKIEILFEIANVDAGYHPHSKILGNEIIIAGNNLFRFDLLTSKLKKEGNISKSSMPLDLFSVSKDTLVLYSAAMQKLLYITAQKVDDLPVSKELERVFSNYKHIKVVAGNLSDFYLHLMKDDVIVDKSGFKLNSFKVESITNKAKNTFFIRNPIKGADAYSLLSKKRLEKKTFLSNKFISAIERTSSSIVLLGTFGGGIYVLKEKPYRTISALKNVSVIGLAFDNNLIYGTTTNGEIFKVTNNEVVYIDKLNQRPRKIFSFLGRNFSVDKKHPNLLYDGSIDTLGLSFSYGPIKDAHKVSNDDVYIASKGLVLKSDFAQDTRYWKASSSKKGIYSTKIKQLKKRIYNVSFLEKKNEIVFSDASGVAKITEGFKITPLLFKNKPINVNSITESDSLIYLGTNNLGVLTYDGEKVASLLSKKSGLLDDNVIQVEKDNAELMIRTLNGIQVYNIPTKQLVNCGELLGLPNQIENNVIFKEDKLLFISDGKIAVVDSVKAKVKPLKDSLKIYADSVLVNGKRINFEKKQFLSSNQNKLSFYYSFRSLKYQNLATIKYRLNGFEDEWSTTETITQPIEFQSLSSGNYKLELLAEVRGKKSNVILYEFKIKPAFYYQWWFIAVMALVLASLISAFFLKRIKKIRVKNEQRLEREFLISSINELKLKSLRSQMNPHFIFNALNAIQSLVLKEETLKSYDYIVTFSELVRNILLYSEKDFISLLDEITFLKNYLKLEELRFKDNFEYEFHNSILQEIKVPSMIIQPFVENAVRHGLLHKKGEKNIKILFEIEDDYMKCEVSDNGIGRKASNKINEQQKSIHQSFSIEATQKRIMLLNKEYSVNARVAIYDIINQNRVAGTKVEIYLPINYDKQNTIEKK